MDSIVAAWAVWVGAVWVAVDMEGVAAAIMRAGSRGEDSTNIECVHGIGM